MEDYLLICWKIIPKWLRMICIWFCLVYTFFKARPRSWPIDTSFWRDIGDTKSTNQHRKCNPEIFAGQKKANVYRGRQKHWCHKRTLVDSILERWFPDHEIEETGKWVCRVSSSLSSAFLFILCVIGSILRTVVVKIHRMMLYVQKDDFITCCQQEFCE